MIEAGIRIYRGALCPSGSPIRGKGELNVELAVSVVLPCREDVSSLGIHGDSGVIVGADPWTRNTLFWPAAEVALRLADRSVIETGRFALEHNADALLADERVKEAYPGA